jgi:PST family polysaccharide transporter
VARQPASIESDQSELGGQVRRALGWSVGNQIALRIASFASGVVLARILTPDDMGVFAVALASMTILVSLNDLGVILGLVRWRGETDRVAPTACSLAVSSSVVLWAGIMLAAGPLANVTGSPEAEGVIRLMSVVVLIDGLAAVALGGLVRDLRQDLVARAELWSIPVASATSIALALMDGGAWSLAIGRIAGAAVTAILLMRASPIRLRFGWDGRVARELMLFGLPLAGTTLVEELLLNLDYFVVGGLLGVEALGFYMLAFNLSNWPISIMREGIRRVSIAGFARLQDEHDRRNEQFYRSIGMVVAVALPICLVLGVLGESVIRIVYGTKWTPAATALGVLAFLGLARVVVGLFFDLLIALGRSRPTFLLQLLWLLTVAPALYFATKLTDSIRGPAVAHVAIAYGVVVPLYLLVLRVTGVRVKALGGQVAKPLLAGALIAPLLFVDRALITSPIAQLLVGGALVVVYGLLVIPHKEVRDWWLARRASRPQAAEEAP